MMAVPRVLTKEQAGIACDRVGIDKRTEEVLNGRPNGLKRSGTNRGSTRRTIKAMCQRSQEEEVHELLEGMSKVNPKQNFLKEQ